MANEKYGMKVCSYGFCKSSNHQIKNDTFFDKGELRRQVNLL